jgi:preprotein translocase subunit SecE
VARNRKRAKDRRSRRPADGAVPEPGLATAGPGSAPDAEDSSGHADEAPDSGDLGDATPDALDHLDGVLDPLDHRDGSPEALDRLDDAPDPLEHAAPDVELAAAQLAVGRPDVIEEAQEDADEFDVEVEASIAAGGHAANANGADLEEESDADRRELTSTGGAPPERRARSGFRLINFLQGSWRELQRVQWPDRRQVIQATGVVLGFVVVAGVYLGLADELSAKIVNFILK